MRKSALTACLFVALIGACKKHPADVSSGSAATASRVVETGSADVKAPAAAQPSAAASAAPAAPGASPLAVKDLGTYEDNAFGEKNRAFAVTNNGKSTVTMVQFYIFHYDKDKKPLDDGGGTADAENYPESLGIKPGATKTIPMGGDKTKEPAGTAFIEAAVTEVRFADGTIYKNDKEGLPDRPMGGPTP